MSSRNIFPATLRWKWILIFAICAACIVSVTGFPTSISALTANWERNVRLGLDLKGGTYLVLQIQVQDAFKTEADKAIDRLKQARAEGKITFQSAQRSDPSSVEQAHTIQITASGVPPAQHLSFEAAAIDALGPAWVASAKSANDHTFTVNREAAEELRLETMTQSLRTIDRKINELGIAETTVQQRAGDRAAEIIVQAPGVDDPDRVNKILQTTALLELTEVIGGPFPSRDAALGSAPAGTLNSRVVRGRTLNQPGEVWWVVARSSVITGRDMRDARAERSDIPGRWDTNFWLTSDAARRFEQFTSANVGKHLAIILDDVALSAPQVDGAIRDRGRIIGAQNAQEAADLALNLRAGSIPAGVKVLETLRIGPSLGADSIRMGLTAGAVALTLVVASMLVYYRGAGMNAVLALLLNTIITVAILSYFGAAWTLPGIAGLVLSIGMSVDSNVLIFERVKEELRNGKPPRASVGLGFDRALTTIIDTHVTTIVASAFLFLFGTTTIRGFAVTLVIGLIANVFTAVFVSRAIFDLQFWRKPALEKISIGGDRLTVSPNSAFDFMRRRKWTLALSMLMITICVVSIGGYGLKQGLDFRGGTLMQVRFDQNPGIDNLRESLASRLSGEFLLQETGSQGEFIIGTELQDEEGMQQTRRIVEGALAENGNYEVRSSGLVGPKAGAEMRNRAIMATLGAFAGMLIYIAFRFQWISGAVAIIATIHDIAITLGLFSLTGREISLNIVAAVLTLIGYSMNDKIVVFDRLRENQLKHTRRSFLELVNESINQTLSRTILTAGPTLLACLALYFLGGEVLEGIAFALFVGIMAGTYSSVFVASALLVVWHERRALKR